MLMYPLDQHNDSNKGKCHIKFRRIIIVVERIQFEIFLRLRVFSVILHFEEIIENEGGDTHRKRERVTAQRQRVDRDHSKLLLAIFRCLSFHFIELPLFGGTHHTGRSLSLSFSVGSKAFIFMCLLYHHFSD